MKEIKKTKNIKTLDQLIEEEFGPIGRKARDKFEKGFKTFERRFLVKSRNLEN